MKRWIAIVVIFFAGFAAKAQYGDYSGPDRYFYEGEFDWRWDVRVRISDGYNAGYLTYRQANRLYRRLEDIERKEWRYQIDGYYSTWEQDDIWFDVVDLHRRIGMTLTDWDRRYYGYSGIIITGRLPWYFGTSYDFYRFDKRGFGSIRLGYMPRHYHPVHNVYYNHRNNYTSNWKEYNSGKTVAPSRSTTNSSRNSSLSNSRTVEPTRSANRSSGADQDRISGSREGRSSSSFGGSGSVERQSSRVERSSSSERVGTSKSFDEPSRGTSSRVQTERPSVREESSKRRESSNFENSRKSESVGRSESMRRTEVQSRTSGSVRTDSRSSTPSSGREASRTTNTSRSRN